jgi:hypothetical protein
MTRRRVAKGRAARERRYESAVYRQITLFDSSFRVGLRGIRYFYAPPEEFLRRGDDLAEFTQDGAR